MRLLEESEVSAVSGADDCTCYWYKGNQCYQGVAAVSCMCTFGISAICCPLPACGDRGFKNSYPDGEQPFHYSMPDANACRIKCCEDNVINIHPDPRYKSYSFGGSGKFNC